MSKLIIILPDATRLPHELGDETVTVGRRPDNVIQLDDPSVSSRHAQVQLLGDNYQLTDLDSTNGTRVNNAPITVVTLRAGDKIRFGKVEACFECEVTGAAQPMPTPESVDAKPAEISVRPADFANASPFPKRRKEKDPTRLPVFAAAALAILAFVASMLSLAQMRPPTF